MGAAGLNVLRRLRRLGSRGDGRSNGAKSSAPDGSAIRHRSEKALKRRITTKGGSVVPRGRPGDAWKGRRNRALLDQAEVDAAVKEVRALGLVPHPDRPKNWDLTVALGTILERTTADATVLEMGAATYSPLLVWLYQYGYRDLHGIDLVYDAPGYRGPILFQPMDLTQTTFDDATFDAIGCLSVIEHGVPFDAYLAEARRVLKPGGMLVTSTDYWATPVDTAGITAYGTPVRILDEAAIGAFLDEARRQGFTPETPLDPSCRDKVVHWDATGLDFTFLVVTLVAPGAVAGT